MKSLFAILALFGVWMYPLPSLAQDLIETSMVQLLSNPDRFHEKRVRVSGYLHNQFEDSVLYLSKEDADFLNGKQGFWVRFAPDVSKQPNKELTFFDSKRVLIEGVFNKNVGGHLGANAGGIEHISRIMEEWQWFDGAKKLRSSDGRTNAGSSR